MHFLTFSSFFSISIIFTIISLSSSFTFSGSSIPFFLIFSLKVDIIILTVSIPRSAIINTSSKFSKSSSSTFLNPEKTSFILFPILSLVFINFSFILSKNPIYSPFLLNKFIKIYIYFNIF